METVKQRSISETRSVGTELASEKIYITIPSKKVSKFRDDVEELKYHLKGIEKEYKSEFFESISF